LAPTGAQLARAVGRAMQFESIDEIRDEIAGRLSFLKNLKPAGT
jgi:hypothetical protein